MEKHVKTPKKIKLCQDSKEWLDWRRSKITASDVSVIMNDNPFKSMSDLYEEKVNGKQQIFNKSMERGKELENKARNWCEKKFNTVFFPDVYEHAFLDWLGCSLDGISICGEILIEIKCGIKSHELAKRGIIPDYYKWQMLCQMEVMNMDKVYYISYQSEEDVEVLEFERDDVLIETMITSCKRFYIDHMMKKVKPSEPEEVEDLEELDFDHERRRDFEIDFKNLKEIRDKIKHWQDIEKYLTERIISRCEGKSVRLGNFKCTKFEVKGNIRYKDIPELSGVNLELYRSPSREQWRIG